MFDLLIVLLVTCYYLFVCCLLVCLYVCLCVGGWLFVALCLLVVAYIFVCWFVCWFVFVGFLFTVRVGGQLGLRRTKTKYPNVNKQHPCLFVLGFVCSCCSPTLDRLNREQTQPKTNTAKENIRKLPTTNWMNTKSVNNVNKPK